MTQEVSFDAKQKLERIEQNESWDIFNYLTLDCSIFEELFKENIIQ